MTNEENETTESTLEMDTVERDEYLAARRHGEEEAPVEVIVWEDE